MADIFIDCEWIENEYITILGAYCYGQKGIQLYEGTLTKKKFIQFLNLRSNNGNLRTFLFCHGPDIGRIENFFDLDLKNRFWCVNTITAFKTFTSFQDAGLGHLEQYFQLPRRYALTSDEINELWNSENPANRQIVLEYNWEDCVNLWKLIRILKKEYRVTTRDLKSIAMK